MKQIKRLVGGYDQEKPNIGGTIFYVDNSYFGSHFRFWLGCHCS